MKMGCTALEKYKLISFDKIPSTQNYALELVEKGLAKDRTVIMAEAQSSGRGRYKRKWVSHHGNLYVSFIYEIEERDPRFSYVIAVAIAETLIEFGVMPTIKWPNDILVNGKKISGTLIEYAKNFIIIGTGINIKTNPTLDSYQTTKLEDYVSVSKSEVLKKLIHNIEKWRSAEFSDVRLRWMDLAAGLNSVVKYQGEPVDFIGINESGALILRRGKNYFFAYGDEISMQTPEKEKNKS